MTHRFAPTASAAALFALIVLGGHPARAQSLEPPPPMPAGSPGYPEPPPPAPAGSPRYPEPPPAGSPGYASYPPPPAAAPPTTAPPPVPAGSPGYPASYPPPRAAALPNTPTPSSAYSDERQDSGLGLEWVWLNAEIGGAYVNMQSFSTSNFGLQKTESGGPVYGVAAGVRLLFLTLGVRVRDLQLSSIGSLWELSAEAALHTRIWRIDPYFGARGGYNFVGSLSSDSVQVATGGTPSDVSVHGFDLGPMAGIDFYLAKFVSIGGDVDAQFLFLQRPVPPVPSSLAMAGVTVDSLPPNVRALYKSSGSSVGFGVTGSAHLGIHF